METLIKYYDIKNWRVIKLGDIPIPMAKPIIESQSSVDGSQTPVILSLESYINEQMKVIQMNSRAKSVLYNAINEEEYKKISSCEIVKKMWDKLEDTYEGTNKVKKTFVCLLFYEYELFQMKEGESVENMFSRLNKLLVNSKLQEKNILLYILRSLPP